MNELLRVLEHTTSATIFEPRRGHNHSQVDTGRLASYCKGDACDMDVEMNEKPR